MKIRSLLVGCVATVLLCCGAALRPQRSAVRLHPNTATTFTLPQKKQHVLNRLFAADSHRKLEEWNESDNIQVNGAFLPFTDFDISRDDNGSGSELPGGLSREAVSRLYTSAALLSVAVVAAVGYACLGVFVAPPAADAAAELSTGAALPAASASSELFDPVKFQPVCPASDGVYQFLKSAVNLLIGPDSVAEYGPLIAGVLLRIRLELCVFESFVYEAVIPFVKLKGLGWVLPLHETVESFVAGTIFAVATNFVLLGSTKIFAVLLIYVDALLGFPTRLLGDLLKKLPAGKPTTEQVGAAVRLFGDVVGRTRKTVEVVDTFTGRYLVFATSIYVVFKFVHFKFFNDIFPL